MSLKSRKGRPTQIRKAESWRPRVVVRLLENPDDGATTSRIFPGKLAIDASGLARNVTVTCNVPDRTLPRGCNRGSDRAGSRKLEISAENFAGHPRDTRWISSPRRRGAEAVVDAVKFASRITLCKLSAARKPGYVPPRHVSVSSVEFPRRLRLTEWAPREFPDRRIEAARESSSASSR